MHELRLKLYAEFYPFRNNNNFTSVLYIMLCTLSFCVYNSRHDGSLNRRRELCATYVLHAYCIHSTQPGPAAAALARRHCVRRIHIHGLRVEHRGDAVRAVAATNCSCCADRLTPTTVAHTPAVSNCGEHDIVMAWLLNIYVVAWSIVSCCLGLPD